MLKKGAEYLYDTQNARTPMIGDIYMVTFDGDGCTQRGIRPAVIFQNNIGNLHSPNVIVLPLTSKLKKVGQPTHVLVNAVDTGLRLDSMVLCENPMCVPKEKLGNYLTTLSKKYMAMIAKAHILATASISFLDPETLLSLMEKANQLNLIPGST